MFRYKHIHEFGVAFGIAALALVFTGGNAHAQWATSGSNIYNTNTGNVGIGTTTPTAKLSITGWTTGYGLQLVPNNSTADGMYIYLNTLSSSRTVFSASSNLAVFNIKGDGNISLRGPLGFTNNTTPMMYVYQSGTSNAERFVVAHSPTYPTWGLAYNDVGDKMIFKKAGTSVATVDLTNHFLEINDANPWQLRLSGYSIDARNYVNPDPQFNYPLYIQCGIPVGSATGTTYFGGHVQPFEDDRYIHLGGSGNRWTAVWAVNGTIQTSDAKEKDNIQTITYGLKDIMQLRPVSFHWKDKPEEGAHLGLIAQEVQPIIREVVVDKTTQRKKDGSVEIINVETLGMNYAELIPVLIKAIQEQQGMIQEQQGMIGQLVAALEENGIQVNISLPDKDKGGVEPKKSGPAEAKSAPASSELEALPIEYNVSQNYPNPFNPSTTISYDVPQAAFVSLKIYDVLGKEVASLVNEHKNAGRYSVVWNATDISSGVYFYKLQAGSYAETKKLVLQK